MRLPDAYVLAYGRMQAVQGSTLNQDTIALAFSGFDLDAQEIGQMSVVRATGALGTIQDETSANEAQAEGMTPEEFVSSVLSGCWLEGLLTGCFAVRPETGPSLAADLCEKAQVDAERHLDACQEALDDPEAESPACAPYCGCGRCVVREVISVTWDTIEEAVRAQVARG